MEEMWAGARFEPLAPDLMLEWFSARAEILKNIAVVTQPSGNWRPCATKIEQLRLLFSRTCGVTVNRTPTDHRCGSSLKPRCGAEPARKGCCQQAANRAAASQDEG